jgi:hypothetical protein
VFVLTEQQMWRWRPPPRRKSSPNRVRQVAGYTANHAWCARSNKQDTDYEQPQRPRFWHQRDNLQVGRSSYGPARNRFYYPTPTLPAGRLLVVMPSLTESQLAELRSDPNCAAAALGLPCHCAQPGFGRTDWLQYLVPVCFKRIPGFRQQAASPLIRMGCF